MLQYLVRHGQSVSNVEERVQGQEDVVLSELGRRQAQDVAAWAGRVHAASPIAEIWSSPLCRARDTAAAIATRIARPLQIEDDLRELHAGVFQGHLWADLEVLYPEAVARWQSGDVTYRIPGGESRADLAARGRAMLEKLAGRDVPSMVVVAHGGILTAALGSLLGPLRRQPQRPRVAEVEAARGEDASEQLPVFFFNLALLGGAAALGEIGRAHV